MLAMGAPSWLHLSPSTALPGVSETGKRVAAFLGQVMIIMSSDATMAQLGWVLPLPEAGRKKPTPAAGFTACTEPSPQKQQCDGASGASVPLGSAPRLQVRWTLQWAPKR